MNRKSNKRKRFLLFFSLIFFTMLHVGPQLNLSTDYFPALFGKYELIQQVHAEEEKTKLNYTDNFLPNPNYLQRQWNLNLMNIGEAWADGYTGQGVRIAVLDTGFYHQHPDISMAGGYSVFSDDPWSHDHSGHGTHIAGIISAEPSTEYQGIAPGAEVYGIKIYHSDDINDDEDVSTDVNSVIKGIEQAVSMEADIIVISSGLNYHDEELYDVIKEVSDNNIMIIAASGNGNLTVNFPAYYDEVLAITAVDEDLNPALDIIYGQQNDFTAPGVNIGGLSIPESSYSYPYIFMSGSSQATPHAAGLAAIFMEKHEARGDEIRKIMEEQAVEIGEPGLFGHGLLYYQGDGATDKNTSKEKNVKNTQNTIDKKSNDEPEDEDNEVRKPFSARKADQEIEEDELLNYRQAAVTLGDEGIGKLRDNPFSYLEIGGTLELLMGQFKSLRLTDEQISEIRQNNHSLILSTGEISWKIPASNFVPGQAVLRLYEGKPVGMSDISDSYSYIWTTSIFQPETRSGIYPGNMEVRFNLDDPRLSNLSDYDAAYFDRSESEWNSLATRENDDILTLETRNTGAIGFFDPRGISQAVTDETLNENSFNPSSIIAVLLVSSSVLVVIIKFRKKK